VGWGGVGWGGVGWGGVGWGGVGWGGVGWGGVGWGGGLRRWVSADCPALQLIAYRPALPPAPFRPPPTMLCDQPSGWKDISNHPVSMLTPMFLLRLSSGHTQSRRREMDSGSMRRPSSQLSH
jgi:hypothetical protein